jgi:hypothetical protein
MGLGYQGLLAGFMHLSKYNKISSFPFVAIISLNFLSMPTVLDNSDRN